MWFETHDSPSSVVIDDGTTPASYFCGYGHNYPWKYIFFDPKNHDAVFTPLPPRTQTLSDWKHEPYAYMEACPFQLNCVDKEVITGTLLLWSMEAELRRIAETHPLGSVRKISSTTPNTEDMGNWLLHGLLTTIEYKRAIEDYTSDVTLSYGNKDIGTGFHYDGLRVAGGVEGTWAEVEDGCTTTSNPDVTTSPGHLYIDIDGGPAGNESYYWANGTNLGLSSTTCTKIRWRFKTSDTSIKAKIVIEFNDASTQEVLADSSSVTFTEGSATITAAKTIDHIRLHADHAQGQVYYDWVQIIQADFTWSNCTNIRFTPASRNVNLGIPGSIALGFQNLGADPARIELDCDLDIQTSDTSGVAGCWKRTGDTDKAQVFLDVMHNQSRDAPWQWLVWGNKGVRFVIDSVDFNEYEGTCTVIGHEYSDSNKRTETVAERWYS